MFDKLYQILTEHYRIQKWWPADTPFEVIVGAILTQNTSWKGVEKALANLKEQNLLEFSTLRNLDSEELAALIRPAGFASLKTIRLKNTLNFIHQNYVSVDKMSEIDLDTLRSQLLSVNGIGPETADTILLYALEKPSFVVDAYTRRLLSRHEIVPENAKYEAVRKLFMTTYPPNVSRYMRFHGMIVETCKDFCLKNNPRCERCPLRDWGRSGATAQCPSCAVSPNIHPAPDIE